MHADVADKLASGMFSSFLELERIEVMRDFSAHRCAVDQPILDESANLTSPSFCTSSNERVYITAQGCETLRGGG